jgi:hypothetical protein
MKFNVNFYIHIYNHPMYIVKNFEVPFKNIHLSYHDGEHYNSIRLRDDFENDVPIDIPLELINCVEQTTNSEVINEINMEVNEEEEKDDGNEEDDIGINKLTYNNNDDEEEVNTNTNDDSKISSDDIIVNGVTIKDLKEKPQKFSKCIMTDEGIILNEITDFKKCHCESNKKYKNCCSGKDVKGEFDKFENIFYCDLDFFKTKIHYEIKDKPNQTKGNSSYSNSNTNQEVNSVTQKMGQIFI